MKKSVLFLLSLPLVLFGCDNASSDQSSVPAPEDPYSQINYCLGRVYNSFEMSVVSATNGCPVLTSTYAFQATSTGYEITYSEEYLKTITIDNLDVQVGTRTGKKTAKGDITFAKFAVDNKYDLEHAEYENSVFEGKIVNADAFLGNNDGNTDLNVHIKHGTAYITELSYSYKIGTNCNVSVTYSSII